MTAAHSSGQVLTFEGKNGPHFRAFTIRIWDVQEGTRRWQASAGPVNVVVWSPDGTRVASAGEDGLVLIWRATDGDLVRRFEQRGRVSALAWSPNGEQLVSGVRDEEKGVLFLWDVQQGALVRTFEGHGGLIWGIDWSREQDVLVSAGADGTVRWRSCRLVVNWVKPRPILRYHVGNR